jgi:hypothetical protein
LKVAQRVYQALAASLIGSFRQVLDLVDDGIHTFEYWLNADERM